MTKWISIRNYFIIASWSDWKLFPTSSYLCVCVRLRALIYIMAKMAVCAYSGFSVLHQWQLEKRKTKLEIAFIIIIRFLFGWHLWFVYQYNYFVFSILHALIHSLFLSFLRWFLFSFSFFFFSVCLFYSFLFLILLLFSFFLDSSLSSITLSCFFFSFPCLFFFSFFLFLTHLYSKHPRLSAIF